MRSDWRSAKLSVRVASDDSGRAAVVGERRVQFDRRRLASESWAVGAED